MENLDSSIQAQPENVPLNNDDMIARVVAVALTHVAEEHKIRFTQDQLNKTISGIIKQVLETSSDNNLDNEKGRARKAS